MHRRGRGSDHAAPGRPPRPTSPLRRRSPRRSRHSRRASACFRRSVPHRVDVAPGGAPPPRRRRGRASRGRLRGGHRQPRAGRRCGVRGLCCSVARPSPINVRRHRARRSITSTSSRAKSDALASVARLLYALVALGFAYIRCVENADDPRPVLELPVGPQNAPFCSFRCRASELSMCGAWGGCEESSVRRSTIRRGGQRSAMASSAVC